MVGRVWQSKNFHGGPPKTPCGKRGRPRKKVQRPELLQGFTEFPDVNDFVRGAVWALHLRDHCIRDIEAVTGVDQSSWVYPGEPREWAEKDRWTTRIHL